MSVARDLHALQAVDDEAASCRATIADIERRLEGDDDLQEARATLAEAEVEREAVRRERRRLEGEVAALDEKITTEEARLYGGTVKNPKELLSLQHEVDGLKAARARLEDQLLSVLERAEANNAAHAAATGDVAALEARWEAQSAELALELARQKRRLEQVETRRAADAATIPADVLRIYDMVRERRGSAVVRVNGSTCGGCRVGVPDTVRRRALTGPGLAQCPTCERILVAG